MHGVAVADWLEFPRRSLVAVLAAGLVAEISDDGECPTASVWTVWPPSAPSSHLLRLVHICCTRQPSVAHPQQHRPPIELRYERNVNDALRIGGKALMRSSQQCRLLVVSPPPPDTVIDTTPLPAFSCIFPERGRRAQLRRGHARRPARLLRWIRLAEDKPGRDRDHRLQPTGSPRKRSSQVCRKFACIGQQGSAVKTWSSAPANRTRRRNRCTPGVPAMWFYWHIFWPVEPNRWYTWIFFFLLSKPVGGSGRPVIGRTWFLFHVQ